MKKIMVLALGLLLALAIALPASAAPGVVVDGQELKLEVPPSIHKGSTLVPLRPVAEALDLKPAWDNASKTAVLSGENTQIKLTAGRLTAYENNNPVELTVAVKLDNGRALVPLRFISEAAGARVHWDKASQNVTITTGEAGPGKYVFGTSSFTPFVIEKPTGELTGFDIDLVNAISDTAGANIKLKEIKFYELIPALKNEEIDGAVSALTVHEARKEVINFSTPYLVNGLCIVIQSDNKQITGWDDLENKKIGAPTGTTAYSQAKKVPGAEVVAFKSEEKAYKALVEGNVNAVISLFTTAAYNINKNGEEINITGKLVNKQPAAIAISKNNTELLKKINRAVDQLKENGELKQIYKKWFGTGHMEYFSTSE